MSARIRHYGWVRDRLDYRDAGFAFKPRLSSLMALPARVDWWGRHAPPPCYDQGDQGSCVANAMARRLIYLRLQLGLGPFNPSRAMIYWEARDEENSTNEDAGCQIRDALKALIVHGVCSEELFPYIPTLYNLAPSPVCYAAAVGHEVLEYKRVDNTNPQALLEALAEGPVVAGIVVTDSFETDLVQQTGIVPMPSGDLLGGHAILLTGYDRNEEFVWFDNSWGTGWGLQGRGKLPLAYATDAGMASDFWLLTKMT